MNKFYRLIIATALTLGATALASAQGFIDDDIYFDAKKAKKERLKQEAEARRMATASAYYDIPTTATNYPGSDTYAVDTKNNRDIDEYNRRYTTTPGGKEVTDSISLAQFAAGDFANTRNIERFSNPNIVSGSNDESLQDYYYSSAAPQQQSASHTTIIVNNPDPWGYDYYGYGYGYPYHRYGYGYNPYYGWGYDPWYWGSSWTWGYGPSWSWGWGGWHDHWHHTAWYPGGVWYPGHNGHYPGWAAPQRPSSSGASMTHRPSGATSESGRRPGSAATWGNSWGGSRGQIPGTVSSGRRPSTSNSGSVSSGRRPSSSWGSSSSSSSSSSSGRSSGRSGRSSSYNSNSSSSYNSHSSSSSWGSSGSSSSGTRGGGGGSFGGGGGSGRSGRR